MVWEPTRIRLWWRIILFHLLVALLYGLLSLPSATFAVWQPRDSQSRKGTIENPFTIVLWGEPGEVFDGEVFDARVDLTITTELSLNSPESYFWLPLNAPPSSEDNEWEGADTPIQDRSM